MLEGFYRCVFATEPAMFKKGNIYRAKKGRLTRENGTTGYYYSGLNDLNETNSSFKFEKAPTPSPHKSLLESGMKVVLENKTVCYVLLETDSLHSKEGLKITTLSFYDENLNRTDKISREYGESVSEIYDGEALIAKREEKSAKDTKIKELEKRLRDIADEIAELKGE